MTTENTSLPALERALAAFQDTLEGRTAVLTTFIGTRIYVLLDRPWVGRSLPISETRLLFVSDGESKEQAMLAVFTERAKAETAMAAMGEFQYPVEVDAQWALLSVPPKVGVRINPNAEPAFKILPELTLELRKIAEANQAKKRLNATTGVGRP
jgi:hypothetical protein